MVEGAGNEVDDARVCEAVMFGFEQVCIEAGLAPPFTVVVVINRLSQL